LNKVLDALRSFQLAESAAFRRAGEALGVSETDLNALRTLLADRSDGLTMKELARDVGVSPAVMTGIVDRLEEKGWIRRQPHRSDRRATVVVPTLDAEDAVMRMLKALDEPLRKLTNSLPEDAAALVRKLAGALEAELRAFDPGELTAN
jgi:DNA-binding MarR family transcriptional regulator